MQQGKIGRLLNVQFTHATNEKIPVLNRPVSFGAAPVLIRRKITRTGLLGDSDPVFIRAFQTVVYRGSLVRKPVHTVNHRPAVDFSLLFQVRAGMVFYV